jgi:hypothetical protein
MNLDELKERFSSEFTQVSERVQESTIYNQLRDRYENMSPAMQKMSIVGGAALVSGLILSIPYSYFSQSSTYVGEFEEKRSTIRELLKVTRESAEVPNINPAPSSDSLRANIENQLKNANLLPEQMRGTQAAATGSQLIPKNLTQGVMEVNLAKLNLRQVIDLGYQIQSINSSVKVTDMVMTANKEDNRYFDVVYKLVSLAVPEATISAPPESVKNFGRGRFKKAPSGEGE